MQVNLTFRGNGEAAIELVAETEAERAILAFVVEGHSKRWMTTYTYTYRPGGKEKVTLIQERPMDKET